MATFKKNELTNQELYAKGDAEEKKIIFGLEEKEAYYMLKVNVKFIMRNHRMGSKVFDNFKKYIRKTFNSEVVDFENGNIAIIKRRGGEIRRMAK